MRMYLDPVSLFFAAAAAYGILVLPPLYAQPDATIYLYGFAGTALATQVAYALIAVDPQRFRPLMLVGVASKTSFALPALLLAKSCPAGPVILPFAVIDLLLSTGFLIAWRAVGRRTPLAQRDGSR